MGAVLQQLATLALVYARGETPAWHRLPHLLTPSNQS